MNQERFDNIYNSAPTDFDRFFDFLDTLVDESECMEKCTVVDFRNVLFDRAPFMYINKFGLTFIVYMKEDVMYEMYNPETGEGYDYFTDEGEPPTNAIVTASLYTNFYHRREILKLPKRALSDE